MPSGMQIDFKCEMRIEFLDDFIIQFGDFALGNFFQMRFRSIVFFVAFEEMHQSIDIVWRSVFNHSPIRFLGFAVAEHFVESGQCLTGSSENNDSRCRTVEAVHDAQKHFAGFVVFVFDVFLNHFRQRFIARFVALHNIADTLVDDNEVVVFVEDLEVGFVG